MKTKNKGFKPFKILVQIFIANSNFQNIVIFDPEY